MPHCSTLSKKPPVSKKARSMAGFSCSFVLAEEILEGDLGVHPAVSVGPKLRLAGGDSC